MSSLVRVQASLSLTVLTVFLLVLLLLSLTCFRRTAAGSSDSQSFMCCGKRLNATWWDDVILYSCFSKMVFSEASYDELVNTFTHQQPFSVQKLERDITYFTCTQVSQSQHRSFTYKHIKGAAEKAACLILRVREKVGKVMNWSSHLCL